MDPRVVEVVGVPDPLPRVVDAFQMDPRGVEASVLLTFVVTNTLFQMDPRGVEARYTLNVVPPYHTVSDGPSWG